MVCTVHTGNLNKSCHIAIREVVMYIYYVYAYLTNNVKTVHALFLELWFRFKQLFWGRASLLEWGMGAGARVRGEDS
ncbi:hypothetical protein FIBSPDRAFT_225280 [Athelia psychrophila]|uniref:Uncharacterized protein n=1 Tax=Athelia psychrophila TaxID=1759441 RepID=A0A166S7J8_9AGAM|nr:hypothetical protein FIBSPDRAFT_225280 [Fibularhizoctonia sp. CBS 109695]